MLAVLQFFDALQVIVLILDFILIYRFFYPTVIPSPLIALIVNTLIVFLLVIPFPWFADLVFAFFFFYGFFGGFKPWEWG
jgi:hypothetical protein